MFELLANRFFIPPAPETMLPFPRYTLELLMDWLILSSIPVPGMLAPPWDFLKARSGAPKVTTLGCVGGIKEPALALELLSISAPDISECLM